MLRTRSVVILLVALLVASAVPVYGGSVSSGGPWTYTRGPIVCQFSGDHGSLDGRAVARTHDYNNGCALLRARLKSNPGAVDSGWETSMSSVSTFILRDPLVGSTAVSSEHRAQNGWDGTFSNIQRPHAW